MPFFFILSLRQVGHLISRVIRISLFYQNPTCFFSAYFLKHHQKFKHCEYVMTDLGYYGLEQDGFKLLMPIKKKKNLPLFDVEKKYNKMIGKIRVVIEHINSQLKTFRILSERYRNRRKKFGLRINLIAALVNRINLQ
ncbi:transposase family protein [Acinetobacter sp. TTH0-4]|uniref:transposase family protein n=1 Tax=Acinetobacter sp. TTH0-4 TaxID=1646498 RepID=UPI0022447C0E|nr:transposase family protein [Acinetobacter sp. TTH0-4]